MTEDELEGLRLLFAFGLPGGKTRTQKAIGQYLDGDDNALNKAPTIRARIDKAITLIKADDK